jgi:hypothetical protein
MNPDLSNHLITLFGDAGSVSAAASGSQAKPQAFALPRLPASLLQWLSNLADAHRHRSGRCLAALLLLDPREPGWLQPEIPSQICYPDAVRWSLCLEDLANRSDNPLIAGSYQAVPVANLDEALAIIPPFDGLHVIQSSSETPPHAYLFCRCNGQNRLADPATLIDNDWGRLLDELGQRIQTG